MSAPLFLVTTIFNLYLMVVLLRLWLQLAKADFYNPFSQFVVKATHPIVAPMRRIIPSIGSFDTATLVLAILVAGLKITAISLLFYGAVSGITDILVFSLLDVLRQSFSLVFYVLLLRAVLSWVSQGRSPVEYVMSQLTEPFLAPIRKIIPPMGGLDLSVLIAIVALKFFELAINDLIGFA